MVSNVGMKALVATAKPHVRERPVMVVVLLIESKK